MRSDIARFRKIVYGHFKRHGRNFPWRFPSLKKSKEGTLDPYKIMVSEIMLQQTQAERAARFYVAFLGRFPNVGALAAAREKEVLRAWQGLGYNRRALYLLRAARIICRDYAGKIPSDIASLTSLPGIGKNTAGAIRAFAFDLPATFIETNIRRAFIHYFFPRRRSVSDEELMPLIEAAQDRKHPRRWYSALMDYGAHLPKNGQNHNRKSAHYRRQAAFSGRAGN